MLTAEQFEEWLMKLDAMMERRKAERGPHPADEKIERLIRAVENLERTVDRGNEARSQEWETRYGSR